MESAEPETSQQIGEVSGDVQVEWTAVIRGEEVSVHWCDGQLHGDQEVLERIGHLPPDRIQLSTVDAARETVGRVLLDPIEVIHLASGPIPPSPDAPTPNEPLPPPPSVLN
jgi:hypothetical protein